MHFLKPPKVKKSVGVFNYYQIKILIKIINFYIILENLVKKKNFRYNLIIFNYKC